MSSSSSFNAADGAGYELVMGRWSKRLAGPFLEFAGVAEDERVLDVGCGTGSLTFTLAKRANVQPCSILAATPAAPAATRDR